MWRTSVLIAVHAFQGIGLQILKISRELNWEGPARLEQYRRASAIAFRTVDVRFHIRPAGADRVNETAEIAIEARRAERQGFAKGQIDHGAAEVRFIAALRRFNTATRPRLDRGGVRLSATIFKDAAQRDRQRVRTGNGSAK